MSEHRDEWARWSETWRSGRETIASVDIEALRARLRSARRRAMLIVASEAVVSLCALWIAFRFLRSDDTNDRMIGVAVAVFTIIVWVLSLWARRGSFAEAGGSVTKTLERAIEHGERRARVSTATYGAAATALAFLFALVLLSGPLRTIALPVGVAVAALIAVVGITLWRDRRNRAELERLRSIYEAMRERGSE